MKGAHSALAAIRIVVGAWFLKSLFTKFDWTSILVFP